VVSASCSEPQCEEADTQAEGRRAPRTNLLLSATIDWDRLNSPVRIRNLSETGALLEGASFPAVGAGLVLRRLDLQIGATVMWCAGSRCGVKFEGTTCVAEWIAGSRSGSSVRRDQLRVDGIQAAIRSGSAAPPPPNRPSCDSADLGKALDGRLAEELAYVARLLQALGDELTDDPMVVQRHLRGLQNLDVGSQILGHVAAVLTSEDRASSVEAIGMEELRARLLRRPNFSS
jgi:hypothetical protein